MGLIIPLLLYSVFSKSVKRTDKIFLTRLYTLVQQHIENEYFNITQLSKEIGMSATQLRRKMNTLTGKSPNKYIRSQRLKKAAFLIKVEELRISEAAYRVGFNSLSYFSKCYREEFGRLPSEI